MPRNRQLSRLVHVSRRSKKYPAQADPPMPRRRALRRYAVPAAAAALLLVVTQVVLAAPPSVTNLAITPDNTPQTGENRTFTITATDTDGDIAEYQWDFDYDGNFVADTTRTPAPNDPTCTSTTCETSHAYSTAGPRSVAVRVVDTDGDGTVDTSPPMVRSINVSSPPPPANEPPVARFTIAPTPAAVGQEVTFDGSTSDDPDGPEPFAETNYDWDLDGISGFETSGSVVKRSFSTPGPRTIRLQVTDQSGTPSAVVEQTLNVNNAAPTNVDFTWTPEGKPAGAAADLNRPVQFNASATDPESQTLTYSWNFGDGTTGSGPNPSHTFTTPGTKSVRLTVSDPHTSAPVVTKDVPVNSPPTAAFTISTLRPLAGQKLDRPLVAQAPFQNTCLPVGSERLGECVEFTSTSTDPDGDGTIATLDWDLDGDPSTGPEGFEFSSNDRLVKPRFAYQVPGNKTLRLRVTDSSGTRSQTATVNLRVNRRPEIPAGVPGFIFVPPSPAINEPIRFSSQVTDADNDITTYEWDLDGNATNGAQGFEVNAGASANYTHSYATSGTRTVRLRATDEGGISVVEGFPVRVSPSKPTGDFSFSPPDPVPGQVVTFNSTAGVSAAGKQILKREWDFDWNGATFTPDASGDSVTHSFASPGPKAVALRITEGPPGSSPDMQGEHIVDHAVDVNAPPRAGFLVSPQEAFVGDGVTLSSTSADPDGRLDRQEWDLDNDGQFDDANAQVVSANFGRAGTYPLALRVTDARGATSTATGQVVIRTRPVPPPPPPTPTPLLSGVLIELQGRLSGKFTRVQRLLVRAPKDSMITVRCLGKKCPKRLTKQSKGSKKLRFKKLERRFRPKTKLIVSVTKNGFIGKQTRWTMRRRKAPLRQDLCLVPGAKKATPCPPG
jgi:large repetitive protein